MEQVFTQNSFDKRFFSMSADCLYYKDGSNYRFIARFKYSAQKKRRPSFTKFLTKNFSTEEYFDAIDSGVAPYEILDRKGWGSYHQTASAAYAGTYHIADKSNSVGTKSV
jgi:hypothetical protein